MNKEAAVAQQFEDLIKDFNTLISPNPLDYTEVEASFLKATQYHGIDEFRVAEFFTIAEELCTEVIDDINNKIRKRTEFFLFQIYEKLGRKLTVEEAKSFAIIARGSFFYYNDDIIWDEYLSGVIENMREPANSQPQ